MTQGSLFDLIDEHEGAGNYSTLFAHSQRDGGRFAGVDPSTMTMAELDAFEKEYGPWVKNKLREIGQEPRIATPAGRHQIVGKTRRGLMEELGYGPDTKFTPEVQDNMAYKLVDRRLAGVNDPAAARAGLRNEWEGFKNVSDEELDMAIANYRKNGRANPNMTYGAKRPAGLNERASANNGGARVVAHRTDEDDYRNARVQLPGVLGKGQDKVWGLQDKLAEKFGGEAGSQIGKKRMAGLGKGLMGIGDGLMGGGRIF